MFGLRPILIFQIFLLIFCAFAVGELAVNFPNPSPLLKPFLAPRLRWPVDQVKNWVETQHFDPEYQRFFYRDPDRMVPRGPELVAAADGLLSKVTFQNGITYFVIRLSFWDVHVVRTPIAGIVEDVETDGVYYQRNPMKAELDESIFLHGKAAPVQQIVTLQTDMGQVKVRLITSYWASRIKVWVHPGQRLDKGDRIGRMLLGSTVVIELPAKVASKIAPMTHVTAGESIICKDVASR